MTGLRGKPELLRDSTSSHAIRPGADQHAEDREARFMGKRAQGAYNEI